MKHQLEQLLKQALSELKQAGKLPEDLVVDIKVDRTKDATRGDYATNLALILARPCKQAPRQLAEQIVEALPQDSVLDKVEIAGAGFINFFMRPVALTRVIAQVLHQGQAFGRSRLGQGQKVLLECFSANPVGHGLDATLEDDVVRQSKHRDFDLDLAKSESSDNSVYDIQYAHARVSSVLRQLKECGLSWDRDLGLRHVNLLIESQESALITLLCRYPEVLELAASLGEPDQLVDYFRDLAKGLHSYYNAVVLWCEDESLRAARLSLLEAVRQVIHNGLTLLGISAPESM